MLVKYLIDGIIIGFSASIPLGPIGVLCIQRTLNKGRLSGFISGMGAAFSDTIYAIAAGFSLSFIISFIEKQLLYIQIFGALLLIILGINIFNSNPAVQLRKQRKGKSNLFQDFFSTFLITISNPLAIFLFLAFFASFGAVKPGDNAISHFVLIGGVLCGASLWWFILSSLINLFRSKINLRRLWWLNKITGAAIVILVVIGFVIFMIESPLG
ncbi:LysE family translocator [Saccharicrinis fermentans]|uniref:Leucine export protein LeuE n=1 Tax=Saccharicrinis fermentans DSM 9555 = JCM 21142 TaxID=869213 RepID=W7Y1V4_9BACT|nr:LysE family transporter [Saccharicrinis fermentans]GAF04860.1 leucine export protein LeuE [Saccharicrinis fermentans DSM 9555 = JCM 21142]